MDDFENLSDEEIQQLLDLGILDEESANLQKQYDQAAMLRNREMPGMRYAGRVAVAANPLEFLTQAYQGYRAGQDMDELRRQQQALLQQKTQGRKTFFDAVRGRPKMAGYGPMPSRNDDEVY